MAGPETRLANRIRKHLKREFPGIMVIKIHGSEFQEAGLPDFIACYEGKFIGLEIKRPGEPHPLTDIQRRKLDKIEAAGGIVGVAHDPEEATFIIRMGLIDQWDWFDQGYHDHDKED